MDRQEKVEAAGRGKGKRVDDQWELNKALWSACHWGETQKIRELIAQGADVNARDQYDWLRWAAIHEAAANAHPAAVEVLLMAGADPNTPDWDHCTPLHYAAWIGGARHPAVAKALLRYGADLHPHAWDGQTPLDLAVRYDSWGVRDVLEGARRREVARMGPLRRLLRGGVPRARLDRHGIRADRDRFLLQLVKEYPEPIPEGDMRKYREALKAGKEGLDPAKGVEDSPAAAMFM